MSILKLERTESTDYAEAQFLDPLLGAYIEVTLQLAADEVFIFDRDGKPRGRWRYAEIVHAFRKSEDRDQVLRSSMDTNARLVVVNGGLYDAIRQRVPGLRPRSAVWSWIWGGLPSSLLSDRMKAGLVLGLILGAVLLGSALWHIGELFPG